ncbi:MAG: oligosaccharide flippase family protein [Paraglaciecola sp.]|uniref:oligosaccharide flippase family protein n=1 Tax=Paraglaciecola sp. TaxID=1920173 RepID=UPI00329A1BD6
MSNSYKNILKTTGVVGAVQVVRLLFGLIRNKLIALYFGTAGLGVWSLYLAFTEMLQSATSLGLEKSAVKQMAETRDDLYQRNLTIQVVLFSLTVLSLFISIVVACFASEFSEQIFGHADFKIGVWVCCGAILFNSLAVAYRSILNGLNEIKLLAVSQLIGILIGSCIVFLLIPFTDSSAIPYYLLIIAITGFLPTFYYVYKLRLSFEKVVLSEAFKSLSTLMRVGLAFWVSAMYLTFITFMTNIYLKEHLNIEALGLYQASWTISNLYVGIILSSMGVAFFPKICKVIEDKHETSKAINEQIEFGLLVSLPFIIGIYIFAPLMLVILYSSDFVEGAAIIRWQMLGVAIRLFGFPFGYALMAKGKALQYSIAQFLFSTINYALIVILVINIGFDGLGINYFLAYLVYGLMVGFLCYKTVGYYISPFLLKIVGVYALLLIASYASLHLMQTVIFYIVGSCIILLSCVYSFYQLNQKLDLNILNYIKSKISNEH